MNGVTISPRSVLATGALTPPANGAQSVGPPTGSGGATPTVTLWDSEAGKKSSLGWATRYRRIIVSLKTDVDGTIVLSESVDGVNYDWTTDFTYTASTQSTWTANIFPQRPFIKIEFTNGSVSDPADWRFAIVGDESSADPGA